MNDVMCMDMIEVDAGGNHKYGCTLLGVSLTRVKRSSLSCGLESGLHGSGVIKPSPMDDEAGVSEAN